MRYETRPWLAVTPWSQVRTPDTLIWTVLPWWPPYQKRITRPGQPWPYLFTPAVMDTVTVLVPDEADAIAALTQTFGVPELLAWKSSDVAPWTCPPITLASVLAHLRDWHRTLDTGTTSHLTHGTTEALAYHWQVHQQQLVHPLPIPHLHTGG
jgi:hypothetical protein